MPTIIHLTHRSTWQAAQKSGSLSADSLDKEGFIHCSFPDQIVNVANRFYHGQADMVLVCLDPAKLRSKVVIEHPINPLTGEPENQKALFPHIYGTINTDAVIAELDFPPQADGSFVLPASLHKTALLHDWAAARAALWEGLDALAETVEICPTWHKQEFFAHLAGWDALIFAVLRDHHAQRPPHQYGYVGIDAANARFVAERRAKPVSAVQLECDINNFAVRTLLEAIPDFNTVLSLPWGAETVIQFVQGAIRHEQNHLLNDVQPHLPK